MENEQPSNCVICGEEYNIEELQSIALSALNTTKFKICKYCSAISNPENDFEEVKNIVKAYLEMDKRILK